MAFKIPGQRRSITTSPVPTEYVGDDRIESFYELAEECDKGRRQECDQAQLYLSSLWVTGARVGEVVLLRPDQVVWNNETLAVYNMRVLKKRGRTVTRRVIVGIERCPLIRDFIKFVKKYRDLESLYLLPKRERFTGKAILKHHTSTQNIYNHITEIHPLLFPHWLRDQRAYFLRDKLGFSIYELKSWFEWQSIEMPSHYIRAEEKSMLEKEGISSIPPLRLAIES